MALIELHLDTPVRERTDDEARVTDESTTDTTASTDADADADGTSSSGGRVRRLVRRLAVLGAVAGAVVAVRRFRGGGEEEPPEI